MAYYIETNGLHVPIGVINAGQDIQLANALIGDCYMFTSAYTGSFVSAFQITAEYTQYYVVSSLSPSNPQSSTSLYLFLSDPNDIGPIPQPNKIVWIPQNSPLVMVGGGTIPPIIRSGQSPTGYVVREQYWALMGDSYSLLPGETRTISYTVTSGKQRTSSTQEQIATSVGVSASAGWGPVSASLSASVNASASAFQQVTVTEETQTFVSDTITNSGSNTNLVLRWQMADMMTVYNTSGVPQSNVTSNSVVVAMEYNQSDLPASSARAIAPPRTAMPHLLYSAAAE